VDLRANFDSKPTKLRATVNNPTRPETAVRARPPSEAGHRPGPGVASNFFACQYCGRLFSSDGARCDHQYSCPENPDNQVENAPPTPDNLRLG
jgi:hypothetical protein